MWVYLLHFTQKYKHAGHYIGFTAYDDISVRLLRHRAKKGSKLVRVLMEAGGDFHLVRTWQGDRKLERRLKNMGGAARLCPWCDPRGAWKRGLND